MHVTIDKLSTVANNAHMKRFSIYTKKANIHEISYYDSVIGFVLVTTKF